MSNTETSVFIILIFLSFACSTTRSNEISGMPSDPGKCYAKCLIPDQYDTLSVEYVHARFTGDPYEEDVDLEVIEKTTPAQKKWIKKRNQNCRSADPADCLVWCLIEEPEVITQYYILLDTTQSQNFEVVTKPQLQLVREGGYTEWREVICENDIHPLFVQSLKQALFDKNLYEMEEGMEITSRLKAAVVLYQKMHGLPVGQLDTETMNHMGIIY